MTRAQEAAAIDIAADIYRSQAAFARRFKLSPQHVCDVKNGRRGAGPRLKKALAKAVSPEALARELRKRRRARAH